MIAITAVTAQNTQGVSAIHTMPTETVLAQIDATIEDISRRGQDRDDRIAFHRA